MNEMSLEELKKEEWQFDVPWDDDYEPYEDKAEEVDWSNYCYEDLWYELNKAEEEDNNGRWLDIWNEIERRRDLYR